MLVPDPAVQEMATFDKARLRHPVTSIACIQTVHGDKTIEWAPGSTDITCGPKTVCEFDAVCHASEFAPRITGLHSPRDAKNPPALFLRGESKRRKTWVTRNILEPAANCTLARVDDKPNTPKPSRRLLDLVTGWSHPHQ
ncbi:hypothetical protein FN846DRAFT_886026 [Sphaerosporella brunnea]|uniref:Uncharacterized protein n=1 Tax=Sphaerosporella brunnea TaxID=1250544 RepID=A0A5J5FBL7_9PEZI|nr:hypothetical protein FN846DRAFT_886026 [Sphaerosporella brunnea]